jgi:hypothetical protein
MDEAKSAGTVVVESPMGLPGASVAGVSIPSIPIRLKDGANADEGRSPSSRHSASRSAPRLATRMKRNMNKWSFVLALAIL